MQQHALSYFFLFVVKILYFLELQIHIQLLESKYLSLIVFSFQDLQLDVKSSIFHILYLMCHLFTLFVYLLFGPF